MAMLTEEEVEHYLDVNPSEIQKLIKCGKLTAYKVGGTYVRFDKEQVTALKCGKKFVAPEELGRSDVDKARDFWKFYSFYVLSFLLVLLLLVLFLQL